MYVIRNKDRKESDFWNNEHGWTDILEADMFAEDELDYPLPLDGEWAMLWEVNAIQFARLIAEAEAEGVWTSDAIDGIAEQMDLEADEVYQIVTRAQAFFDEWKAKITGHSREADGSPDSDTTKDDSNS
jgi:hypothetical protein